MNNISKIKELINSLIDLTRNNKIEWDSVTEYIEENRNEVLRRFIINSNEYYDAFSINSEPYFEEYYSYCAQLKSGLVYVFSYRNLINKDQHYILSIQNKKASSIIKLNTNETHQEEIQSLLFYIKNQFDNIDSFVDSIISEGKKISLNE